MKLSLIISIFLLTACQGYWIKNEVPEIRNPCAPNESLALEHAKSLSLAFGLTTLANSSSAWPRILTSNKLITFNSFSTNLTSVTTSGSQAYIYDPTSGETQLVSTDENNVMANAASQTVRADCSGEFVAFSSRGTNLTSDVVPGTYFQMFLKDLKSGVVKLVSSDIDGNPANAVSSPDGYIPQVSLGGKYVGFVSSATNLVATPVVASNQIYRKNIETGEIILVTQNLSSEGMTGIITEFDMSSDGETFVFSTDSATFPGSNLSTQIYVKSISNNTLTLLSKYNGVSGNGESTLPQLSGDGRYVFFFSTATNLTSDNTYTHAPSLGSYYRLKLSDGTIELIAKGASVCCNRSPSPSYDGKIVAFHSDQSLGGITNTKVAAWAKNMDTGEIHLVSTDSSGAVLSTRTEVLSLSGDGKFIAYQGLGSNLYPGDPRNPWWQLYVGATGF